MLTAPVGMAVYIFICGGVESQFVTSNNRSQAVARNLELVGDSAANTPGQLVVPESARFQSLIFQWHEERGVTSSAMEMAMCNAYQRIIAMGERAVPLILRQMEREGDEPDFWFWALRVLTNADPVQPQHRGNIVEMARAWLEWGHRQNVY